MMDFHVGLSVFGVETRLVYDKVGIVITSSIQQSSLLLVDRQGTIYPTRNVNVLPEYYCIH